MWREHALFTTDEPSYHLILYNDDFNVVNPLGYKVVKYKYSAFYFSCNIAYKVWVSN